MSEAGVYSLRELLKLELNSTPLVDQLLWERDNIFIIGSEKTGKSLLALQLGFALCSGQAFLGEYPVRKKCRVLMMQAEGKLLDTKVRAEEMMAGNDVDLDNLHVAYFPSIALNTEDGYGTFRRYIDDKELKPEIIIIDPLYHAMTGSMCDDGNARAMTSNLRRLGDHYGATIIVVHHTHKPIRGKDGDLVSEGDGAIFGSFTWKAWADHTLLFEVDMRNKIRILSCKTQRSGKVLERDELVLIDKPYLGFDRKADERKPYELLIRRIVEESKEVGCTREELMEQSKLSISAIEKSLRKLIFLGEAVKDKEHKPVRYWSRGYEPVSLQTKKAEDVTNTPPAMEKTGVKVRTA